MDEKKNKMDALRNNKGITAVFVLMILFGLIGVVALAVDIGYLKVAKNEAQNAADAAALAAAGELGDQHLNGKTVDETTIRSVAKAVAGKNIIAGQSVNIINDSDIEIGYWDPESHTFSASPIGIIKKKNAVRVTIKRNDDDDDDGNGPISTFFAKALGIDSMAVLANATAALTGASKVPEGALMPIGISAYWFEYDWPEDFCDQNIKFYPTGDIDGCAGWNTFTDSPAGPNLLRDIFEEMLTDFNQSPETVIGDSFEFTGGTIKNALCHPNKPDLEMLYEKYKDASGNWEVLVVVYDYSKLNKPCGNPNTSLDILGFVTTIIHGIDCDKKEVVATVECDKYISSRGGGGMYGTFGNIPNLVE